MASTTVLSKVNRALNFFLAIVRFRAPSTRNLNKQQLLEVLHIKPPLTRIYWHDFKFLYKIVNGHSRSGDILHELFFRVAVRSTRSNDLFALRTPRLATAFPNLQVVFSV